MHQRAWVMVHEWKVGHLDLAVVQGEHLCVHEVVVAHIVYLNTALMVRREVVNHVFLAVTEQFEESLSWETHGDYAVCDVAQIQVELRVGVPVAVTAHKLFDYGASARLFLALLAVIDGRHEVDEGCVGELVDFA